MQRNSMLMAVLLGTASFLSAQTSGAPPKALPWTRYCQPEAGFCFKYPASWTMLGEVFDGHGVVVVPPQKQDRALWDEITVAIVAPPPQGDEEGIGLDGVIAKATTGLREAGQDFRTLQRQQRTVDHQPAEMLKAQYREKSTGHDWIEELVFIEGTDNAIYSVALKCSPQTLARLEPVFAQVVRSWTVPEPEAPQAESGESAPTQPPHPANTQPQR